MRSSSLLVAVGVFTLGLALPLAAESTAPAAAAAPAESTAPTALPAKVGSCPPSKDEDLRQRQHHRPGTVGQDCVPTTDPDGAPVVPAADSAALRVARRYSAIPRPGVAEFDDPIAVPDRWRIVDALYEERWYDPYNRNLLKGDKPIHGDDWFFSVSAIADSVYESRRVPTPVGGPSTGDPGANDVFGDPGQDVLAQTVAVELVYLKGSTVFQPPDYEFRLTPAFNINYANVGELQALNVDPRTGTTRTDQHFGLQAAFFDYHLRNVSDNFDFDSFRIGIQPFNADFRGFLFQDSQLGARVFGTRHNNVFQYNLALFRRLEKDTNSGLNDVFVKPRRDDVLIANVYWQDLFKLGLQSQFTVAYNRNREDRDFYFDHNGFLARPAALGSERPRRYDVTYIGSSL
ncbi:MAG: hypothetical protein CO182_11235, partial [Lysobacterales bacterium CG_4_9_14_3_um_filter_62_6]